MTDQQPNITALKRAAEDAIAAANPRLKAFVDVAANPLLILHMCAELSRLQAGGQGVEPTAFVHWPLQGAPRLVWYSNKVMEEAILKTYEGYQQDLLLYPHPPAAPALVPLPHARILELHRESLERWGETVSFARAIESEVAKLNGLTVEVEP